MQAIEFDVVVVGCGIAGLSAAITAQQNGARVAVLERAPQDERGGNTRYTESFWRMKSEDAVSDDFEDRFAANAGGWPDPGVLRDAVRDRENQPRVLRALGLADPHLIATIAEEAPKALKWLKEFGVKFDFLPLYFLSQSTTRMGPIGGGLALIEALGAYADDRPDDIAIFYETAARGLIHNDEGAIIGIRAVGPGNKPMEIRGRSVILASGGFEGNQEMLSHYMGPQAQFIRPVARGGHYNRGEGVAMALEAGAASCGDYGSFHAQPVDPRSTDIEPVVLNYSYGILVNDAGQRFTDEAPGMVDATYEAVARIIMGQRHGIAYAVFDAGLDDVENWPVTVRSRIPPLEAGSLDELAGLMEVDARDFSATVEAYNQACPVEEKFDPLRTDGLATTGLALRKSHWARPIVRPPFKAWPMICANCFTFGGVKIDERARVINAEGDAIPGLYAAGEVAGIYYRVYTGATSVMRGAVTGRLAGEDAARRRNSREEQR
ncbi:MAG: FAD-dependent oxidoreductase [Rhodospirillaceae bacterium]|jgi:tricarballylate dehydrogenase|nr:FAD-dependent oxidoreductase [Rhodospirillaceae bacterium]MBT4691448.1 FAD-dependent oxidoreductase [Rhodospirillaceae bacterium]MBT5082951.1 FAD-dependent oxidoreductase [Rhodospirillaceae bacterium]MBT5524395.1 FAD-dependent oxidoreductase [Rhodospirillaceae bacterium]MBT5878809.1 FAD-dependent oxidoreductase [Rhodospirillaceae bacterium]